MDERYTFTLTKDEYLDFLRYQAMFSKGNRGKKLWLTTSVPMLIIVSIIFFKIYTYPWLMALGVMMIVIWVAVAANAIWERFIRGRISDKMLDRIGLKDFHEVTMHFMDDRVIFNSGSAQVQMYSDIKVFVPISAVLIFGGGGNRSLLLPTRAFENETKMKQFIREFEKAWDVCRTANA